MTSFILALPTICSIVAKTISRRNQGRHLQIGQKRLQGTRIQYDSSVWLTELLIIIPIKSHRWLVSIFEIPMASVNLIIWPEVKFSEFSNQWEPLQNYPKIFTSWSSVLSVCENIWSETEKTKTENSDSFWSNLEFIVSVDTTEQRYDSL